MIFSDSDLPVKDQCFKHPSAMQVVIGPDEGTRHTGFLLMCEERQIRFVRCNGASSQVYKDVIPNWRGSSGPCGLAFQSLVDAGKDGSDWELTTWISDSGADVVHKVVQGPAAPAGWFPNGV